MKVMKAIRLALKETIELVIRGMIAIILFAIAGGIFIYIYYYYKYLKFVTELLNNIN